MRRFFLIILWIISVIIVVSLQQGFVRQWGSLSTYIQLDVLAVILLTIFYRPWTGLIVSFVIGSWMDLSSSLPFGVYLGAISLASFAALFLRDRVLKQDAEYAVVLPAIISTWVFWGGVIGFTWIDSSFSATSIPAAWYELSLRMALWQSLTHGIVAGLYFVAHRLVSKRFVGIKSAAY